MIPAIQPEYVPWGNFEKIKTIIESKKFFPVWITGLSGNGKTSMIEQACAAAGRGFYRINFTNETDEQDMVGSIRLVNGDTHFEEGVVVKAMREGSILLLDEIDVGHVNKVLVLQSVMEGNGVLIKATGEYVKPKKGFNIFATSNTKGRGSDDGRFVGTSIMNAAFLDRFHAMLFQDYPDSETEQKILQNYYVSQVFDDVKNIDDIPEKDIQDGKDFIGKLTKWAGLVRESYNNGSDDVEVITTRSLISIIKSYSIFNDKNLAVQMICERFDNSVRDSLLTFYEKVTDDTLADEEIEEDIDDEYIDYTNDD